MTIFCPPPGVSRLGVLPFRQCFMLASDDGITPVVACKLSLLKKKSPLIAHVLRNFIDVQYPSL